MENNKDGILLETGTNEIEIMEFTIDGNLYGINVAKVREIMLSAPVHPMPHAQWKGFLNPGTSLLPWWICRSISVDIPNPKGKRISSLSPISIKCTLPSASIR